MMDRDKIREILRLETIIDSTYKEMGDLQCKIMDFKSSLSENPTDEELDKFIELENKYDLRERMFLDKRKELKELKELKEGKKKIKKESGFL